MDADTASIFCPWCGQNVTVPTSLEQVFCPACGKRFQNPRFAAAPAAAATPSADDVIAQAQRAVEQAQRVAAQAAQAAALAMDASALAPEAAQQVQRIVEQSQQAADQATRTVAEASTSLPATAPVERFSLDEAEPAPEPQAQPVPELQPQPAPEPQPAHHVPSGIDPDGTIRDQATKTGLFVVHALDGWHVTTTTLRRTNTSSRPYIANVELHDQQDGIMMLGVGPAGTRQSKALKGMTAIYGGHLIGIDTATYAEMPNPVTLADDAVTRLSNCLGGKGLTFVTQYQPHDLEAAQQQALAQYQMVAQVSGGMPIGKPLAAIVLRTYQAVVNGAPWKLAAYVRLEAVKDTSGMSETGMPVGGLLGNMFGGKDKKDQEKLHKEAEAARAKGTWSLPDLATYAKSGTIFWSISTLATFAAPVVSFDQQLFAHFAPAASTLIQHRDMWQLCFQVVQQENAAIQAATQGQLARNQAAFNASQAANRQLQAAYDSYHASVMAASDAHHRQFLSSSNAQFNSSAPDYSEAIRGVNTYTTSDGREVQISVQADRAYENQAGDVIGWSGADSPGIGWSEIPRT
jgi:hypothetical protein